MIKNILFDLGGVVITLDQNQAIRRFQELGLHDADKRLDAYTQDGIFGDLERGAIDTETFRKSLSQMVGRELSLDECGYAWRGYCSEVPQRNLDTLLKLRAEGYRIILVSNTNPFMMDWAMSPQFDGCGHSLNHFVDACYLSYQCGMMKPDEKFFRKVLMSEHINPEETLFLDDGPRNVAAASELGIHTICPKNGEDWTDTIYTFLNNH